MENGGFGDGGNTKDVRCERSEDAGGRQQAAGGWLLGLEFRGSGCQEVKSLAFRVQRLKSQVGDGG